MIINSPDDEVQMTRMFNERMREMWVKAETLKKDIKEYLGQNKLNADVVLALGELESGFEQIEEIAGNTIHNACVSELQTEEEKAEDERMEREEREGARAENSMYMFAVAGV